MVDAWRHANLVRSGGLGKHGTSGISHICLDARTEHHALIDARTPRDGLEATDEHAAVRQLVGRLGERQRQFVVLHFGLEGEAMDQQVIAKIMKITPSRVSQIMHGALQELRKWQGRVNK
ncbi:MAG: sigma-70 family RNA polymerase sigma factor [Pseudomonadota bacterium]